MSRSQCMGPPLCILEISHLVLGFMLHTTQSSSLRYLAKVPSGLNLSIVPCSKFRRRPSPSELPFRKYTSCTFTLSSDVVPSPPSFVSPSSGGDTVVSNSPTKASSSSIPSTLSSFPSPPLMAQYLGCPP